MNIVVVGAGLAGANAVEELRAQGHTGDIVLLGAEQHPPYERPPLSKSVLLGEKEPKTVFVHDEGWYAEHEVDLRTGTTATGIDLDRGRVATTGGDIPYDRLLLATGAEPRRLPDLDGAGIDVAYLRTLDDSLALRPRLGGKVLIVGAGWIGLEVAAAARQAGGEVTVVETAELPLLAALGREVASYFADLHRGHGVDLRLSTGLAEIDGGTVRLSDRHELRPDLVVVGIGVRPDQGLAQQSGLAVDNGVLVDPWLRASDPHVFGAGDVANHDHPRLGRRVRVEHWDNAIEQGRHAGRTMLGADAPYERLPYFFTDQYDAGMEYLGTVGPDGYDEAVVRGDLAGGTFTAFWLSGGEVVAGMHVNDWDAMDPIRSLVGRAAPERLRDGDVPLAELTG